MTAASPVSATAVPGSGVALSAGAGCGRASTGAGSCDAAAGNGGGRRRRALIEEREELAHPHLLLRRHVLEVAAAIDDLPEILRFDAIELIEHGEPAEGLCSLAWAIVNAKVRVPRELIDAIYKYTSGLVDEKHLPPDLADYADGYR